MNKQQESGALAGRLIIVTGASSGVGYGAARRLVQNEGATVVAVARRRVFRIEALAAQIGGDRLIPITADMAAREQADALVRQVLERFGQIDGFVHAVNRILRLTALEVSDPEFDLTMQVNVKSALYSVQAIAPTLRERKSGAIVIYNPMPRPTSEFVASEAVYSASAYALSALTAGWTRQLEGAGIRVCGVSPALPQSALGLPPSHDSLLITALREAFEQATAPTPAADTTSVTAPLTFRPHVLNERGGLSLLQF
jgi:NAD(P)-dependent dehydrogenase (short-subunit alcohol dehydrogenase family)